MTIYNVNKKVLAKCKELGHCVCNLTFTCPCDDFLNNDICKCKAYIKVKELEIPTKI